MRFSEGYLGGKGQQQFRIIYHLELAALTILEKIVLRASLGLGYLASRARAKENPKRRCVRRWYFS